MERFPVRLQYTVVSLDQAVSHLDSLACPFALLAFDLTWNELIWKGECRLHAPDQ